MISHLKTRSKMALAIPPVAPVAWSLWKEIDKGLLATQSWCKSLPGLTLGHPLGSDLDPGLAERLEHCLGINAKCCCCLSRETFQARVGTGIKPLGTHLYVMGLTSQLGHRDPLSHRQCHHRSSRQQSVRSSQTSHQGQIQGR